MNILYFYIPTYVLINILSFVISFITFVIVAKKEYKIIDIIYSYLINIIGMIVGAKIIAFIENSSAFDMGSFIKSGYSFIGAIIGSNIFVKIYCTRYSLKFDEFIEKYYLIYPLFYSISKIGCFISGCCGGTIFDIPVQLVESITMFVYFVLIILLKKKNNIKIEKSFICFVIAKFIFDFCRENRKCVIGSISTMQIICMLLIIYYILIIGEVKKYE